VAHPRIQSTPVNTAVTVLQDLVLAGLVVASAIAALQFARKPGIQRGYLAAGLALIALQAIFGLVGQATEYRYRALQVLGTLAFLGSAYLLLMFRHSFVPVARWWRIVAAAALIGVGIAAIAVALPYAKHPTYSTGQAVVLRALVIVWSAVLIEPTILFWMASRTRARVQRIRLRLLSIAFALIVLTRIAIVLARTGPGRASAIIENSIALLFMPLLYLTLIPPDWLRRVWRREEDQERMLTRNLVMFAPDRSVLAQRALQWALRLVGSSAGFILDVEGRVLARNMVSEREAEGYFVYAEAGRASLFQYKPDGEFAIAVPIVQERGRGLLVVIAGPFTLLFGSDEMETLEEHAEVIGFALDRVTLTETRQQLEESKTQFLANAAHELRTPLASIVGFAELFAGGIEKMPPDAVHEGLSAIVRQGRRMASLVNDLLDLSQLELGKARMKIQPMPLAPTVEQSIANAQTPDGSHVHMNVPPDLRVIADPNRLDQVLTNLLSNAFRHGGPNVEVEAHRRNGSVTLVVADDGPGIPADLRPHLFEPFSRALDAQAKEGSGLGLAIARSLVEAFGGSLSYEPADGGGARFIVQLPAAH
ncbi:MAG TPA: HAMP domain-containing sensor histidine kinase, partial [Actinomycetota bacterium]|nr:HAMP domain-containing sensor histidine kinase [Actinomycetota bacterium]